MKSKQPTAPDPAQVDLFAASADDMAPEPSAPTFEQDTTAPTVAPATTNASRDAATLLATLTDWADRGWIRRLDAALARFIADTCAGTAPTALLAIAMTAHMEGQGHACVDLRELVDAPESLLGWKPEPYAGLVALMARLPRDLSAWLAALANCAAVIARDPSPHDQQALVLTEGRLYLRRYWDYERRLAEQVRIRVAIDKPIDAATTGPWLDRLFGETKPGGAIDWQKVACAIALRGRFTIITGGPGTGKTYTAARLLALQFALAPDRERFRVALAAPTGKAAARLKQAIDGALVGLQGKLGEGVPLQTFAATLGPAKTLHALLGARPDTRHFRHDAANLLELDVLVVDEASMVHLEMMAALLDALPAHAHVVLLGDKDQLESVEAGAVLGELCRDADRGHYTADSARYIAASTGHVLPAAELDAAGPALAQRTVMLRDSQRFGGAIGALAQTVNAGDAEAASALLVENRDGPVCWMPNAMPAAVVELAVNGRVGAPGGYRDYLHAIRQRPSTSEQPHIDAWARDVLIAFDRFRVLCAVREGDWGVTGLNRAIEKRLREGGSFTGTGEWYEGRPVIVSRNDRALGVYNGDIGIALRQALGDNALRAYFVDGDAVRSVAVSRLADVETAFAMTVHKSQGSEFAHTVLVLPPETGLVTSRELVYTGITRARSALTLVARSASALTDAIAQSARRSSGLHERLQRPDGLAEPI